MKNVGEVYKKGLCNSCGVCQAVCGKNAITYKYDLYGFLKPVVSENCINCGACVKACPGEKYYLNEQKEVCEYFTLHSTDDMLRNKSASGGFTTEFLCYLLNKHIVDYCVVIPRVKNSLAVEPVITKDIDQIKESCGSKYIPVQYGSVLSQIKNSNDRYALVVLPCQEYAIKKYLKKGTERIFFVTLMCNHMSGNSASRMILSRRAAKGNVFSIDYRGEGWPGKMKVNDEVIDSFRNIYGGAFGRYFFNFRCKMCNNHFGKSSVMTVADPYYITENGAGNTCCICRDSTVRTYIEEMIQENQIENVDLDITNDLIERSYKGIFIAENYIPRLLWLRKKLKLAIPNGSEKFLKNVSLNRNDYVEFLSLYKDRLIGRLLSAETKIKYRGKD